MSGRAGPEVIVGFMNDYTRAAFVKHRVMPSASQGYPAERHPQLSGTVNSDAQVGKITCMMT